MTLVLASSSPRRKQLLAHLGVPFDVWGSDLDEGSPPTHGRIDEAVTELAMRKAAAAAEVRPFATVLAADTVVVLDGQLLGKPADESAARELLERMSGRRVSVLTAAAVAADGETRTETVTTELQLRTLGTTEVERYVATGAARDKAGGLEVQGRARPFVRAIDGCWTNVVGLPLCATSRLLRIDYPDGACAEP